MAVGAQVSLLPIFLFWFGLFFVKKGFLCVALAVLDIALQTRQVLNSTHSKHAPPSPV